MCLETRIKELTEAVEKLTTVMGLLVEVPSRAAVQEEKPKTTRQKSKPEVVEVVEKPQEVAEIVKEPAKASVMPTDVNLRVTCRDLALQLAKDPAIKGQIRSLVAEIGGVTLIKDCPENALPALYEALSKLKKGG